MPAKHNTVLRTGSHQFHLEAAAAGLGPQVMEHLLKPGSPVGRVFRSFSTTGDLNGPRFPSMMKQWREANQQKQHKNYMYMSTVIKTCKHFWFQHAFCSRFFQVCSLFISSLSVLRLCQAPKPLLRSISCWTSPGFRSSS